MDNTNNEGKDKYIEYLAKNRFFLSDCLHKLQQKKVVAIGICMITAAWDFTTAWTGSTFSIFKYKNAYIYRDFQCSVIA